MKSAIKDLWNGNIAPCDCCGSHDSEINELITLMERHRTTLCNHITPTQQEILEKYIDCSDEYLLRLTEHAFCDGFCLATRLLTEALN